jgi:hypothetical protein
MTNHLDTSCSVKIFRDPELNTEFQHQGFVRFPLFSQSQLSELLGFYEEHVQVKQRNACHDTFHTTSNTSDNELIHKVSSFIKPFFMAELPKYIDGCNFTISNYLVKESGPDSAVSAHQDWTFVDEDRFVSFNVWVCLGNADYFTGNMQFVPGSHRFKSSLRVSPGQPRFYDEYIHRISDYLVDVPTKSGECVVFHHSIIHASRKNRSGAPRISCVIAGYPNDADLYHYFWEPGSSNDRIEKYQVCNDSFLDLRNDCRPPHSKLQGHIKYDFTLMPWHQFKLKCRKHVPLHYMVRNRLVNAFIGKSS